MVFVILQGAGGAADILTAALKYIADESSNDEVTAVTTEYHKSQKIYDKRFSKIP